MSSMVNFEGGALVDTPKHFDSGDFTWTEQLPPQTCAQLHDKVLAMQGRSIDEATARIAYLLQKLEELNVTVHSQAIALVKLERTVESMFAGK